MKRFGSDVIEMENRDKLKGFTSQVLTRLVKFWSDTRDIKLHIMDTMAEFSDRKDLIGWIRGDQAVTPVITEQLAQLTRENKELRKENEELRQKLSTPTYNGRTYEELYHALLKEKLPLEKFDKESIFSLKEITKFFEDEEPALIHFFWFIRNRVQGRWNVQIISDEFYEQIKILIITYGLLQGDTIDYERNLPKTIKEQGVQTRVVNYVIPKESE